MDEAIRVFGEMVRSGCRFSEVAEALRSIDAFKLTPFNLLRVAYEALGVPVTESRALLKAFGENMVPIEPAAEVDRIGDVVLGPYR
jgi:hypothetical protein